MEDVVLVLQDRPVAYHPILARAIGSVKSAIFLSQLLYWTGRQKDRREGWIYKTEAEFEEETALTRHEQAGARKLLVDSGILEIERREVPARLFYRLNKRRISELLSQLPESAQLVPALAATSDPKTGELVPAPAGTISPTESTTQRVLPRDSDIACAGFSDLWKLYPSREGSNSKNKAYLAYRKSLDRGVTHEAIHAGLLNYRTFVESKGIAGTSYVMQAARFFGPGDEWTNDWRCAEQRRDHELQIQRDRELTLVYGELDA